MNKINACLLALVVICAWSVVTSHHVSRKLYNDLQKEQKATRQLEVEFSQLQLEQSTWGTHSLIEKIAADRLGMYIPDQRQIQLITPAGVR